jgi:CubicO group peptidase (beta-lactamase class C family)
MPSCSDGPVRPSTSTQVPAWQYSNTNYTIAGAIVERVAGVPFMEFLKRRIFNRLDMKSVADFDAGPLQQTDAGAYLRNGIGPLREAPKEGPRWLFAAGQLAMTAHDLATWDLSVIKQTILKPASYRAQQTTTCSPMERRLATAWASM